MSEPEPAATGTTEASAGQPRPRRRHHRHHQHHHGQRRSPLFKPQLFAWWQLGLGLLVGLLGTLILITVLGNR